MLRGSEATKTPNTFWSSAKQIASNPGVLLTIQRQNSLYLIQGTGVRRCLFPRRKAVPSGGGWVGKIPGGRGIWWLTDGWPYGLSRPAVMKVLLADLFHFFSITLPPPRAISPRLTASKMPPPWLFAGVFVLFQLSGTFCSKSFKSNSPRPFKLKAEGTGWN